MEIAMSRLDTITEQVRAREEHYVFERNAHMIATCAAAGSQDTVVCVGGYRLIITTLDGELVCIRPKARSAGRGQIVAWAGDPDDSWTFEVLGRRYWQDAYGPMRLQEALVIASCAWESAGGNINAYYRALGERGFCAMCGALLTDPLSRDRGIGPECIKRVYKREAIKYVQGRNLAAA